MTTKVLVTQHGARGDGLTDDRSAILRALAIAVSRGAELVFPPGRYLISQPVELPTGSTLLVEGSGATLVAAGVSAFVGAMGAGEGRLRIRGLAIAGDASPSSVGIALDSAGWGEVVLQGVHVRGFATGIRGSGLDGVSLQSCLIESCGTGLVMTAATRLRLESCVIRGATLGVHLAGGEGISVASCLLEGNEVDLLLGTGASGLSRVHLSGNRLGSPSSVVWQQEGLDTSGAATGQVNGLAMGPGDSLAGTLTIPTFASNTVLVAVAVTSVTDLGTNTTILGVDTVTARISGRDLFSTAGQPTRGLGAPTKGILTCTVKFGSPEADTNYALAITPTWNTTFSVLTRRTDGFDVKFGTLVPTNARFDWILVR